jgi:hypothetical protein
VGRTSGSWHTHGTFADCSWVQRLLSTHYNRRHGPAVQLRPSHTAWSRLQRTALQSRATRHQSAHWCCKEGCRCREPSAGRCSTLAGNGSSTAHGTIPGLHQHRLMPCACRNCLEGLQHHPATATVTADNLSSHGSSWCLRPAPAPAVAVAPPSTAPAWSGHSSSSSSSSFLSWRRSSSHRRRLLHKPGWLGPPWPLQ